MASICIAYQIDGFSMIKVPTPSAHELKIKQASDHTGQSWLTCFGEAGETLFNGIKAPELKELEINDPKAYDKCCTEANMSRFLFKLKVAEETYNDERRVKVSIQKMEAMDYVKECQVSSGLRH